MDDTPNPTLQVEIRELPVVRVGCMAYKPSGETSNLGPELRQRFERVQAWVGELGLDPYTRLTIGSIVSADERLLRYECCLEIPDTVETCPEDIRIKKLPGGRFAVMSVDKEPQTVVESIRRFYEQWAPEHDLKIDAARPTYEIYWAETMDYCVPVL